ncbi:MAG: hypothetical protein Q4B96_02930 [Bacillota bacterium]|nr:hypothetical protein [Bacillota bacterium]
MELLLFTIKDRAGVPFLSDLHLDENRPAVNRVLCALTPEDYSLPEWQNTLTYITGKELVIESLDEVRHYLQELAIQLRG